VEGDTMKSKMHKAFQDAEGAVSLEQVVEIATALPEAIKKVPVDELIKLMPAMQQIMSYAKEQGAVPVEDEYTDMEEGEEEGEEMKDGMKDEDMDKEKEFADAKFKDKLRSFADSEVKRFAGVVTKARNFVDAEYDFTAKTANAVMRDALATQSTDHFEDAELSVAFKLLRKANTDYSQFGDAKPDNGLAARITQTLEG
jgi:hypothetical protein